MSTAVPLNLHKCATVPEDWKCSICLEGGTGFFSGRIVCHEEQGNKHPFHKGCLFDWMILKSTCPFCSEPLAESRDIKVYKTIAQIARDVNFIVTLLLVIIVIKNSVVVLMDMQMEAMTFFLVTRCAYSQGSAKLISCLWMALTVAFHPLSGWFMDLSYRSISYLTEKVISYLTEKVSYVARPVFVAVADVLLPEQEEVNAE